VFMGYGRRGLSKLLLGSEATRVLTSAPVPVLICR
jgi:nucleotide-binding universal stress UspA family protein